MTTIPSECSQIRAHVPIAICGYSYRLPGGLETDKDFWDLLARRGYVQECIDDRYGAGSTAWDGFTEDNPMSLASPWEGLIRDGRELEFDCALFGISVNDAKRMDPQIKMMLMITWEALQCAGMDQAALHNSRTGVFTGIQTSAIAGWRPLYGAKPGDVPGKSGSMIANRISFHFNWTGPSFSVATACSSGITALDAAVKSLDVGECDMAAFGAVQYLGLAQSSVGFNALGIISKTGSSRSFDKDANGYMRAEGAFIYLLKRLDDAERDGDRIFGVIRGCALNCAGAEPSAEILTQGRMIVAPVLHAQQLLMNQIVTSIGVDPKTVDYVEAHATGTVLGDAIEGNAIANVYGGEEREFPLRLSSVRSNMGHMEAGSFTCSLLKCLLMLQNKHFLPVSSHHKEATDKIPFEAKKMRVQTELEPFPEQDNPVRIGINSFGFGGANGHCLLEEYKFPPREEWSYLPGGFEHKSYMIPLSAKSDEALIENARQLAERLDQIESQGVDMYTLVGNLSTRMTHHRVRTALTATNMTELKESLAAFAERAELSKLKDDEIAKARLTPANDPRAAVEKGNILMVFPGQGSQWAGCGRELYETEVVFRRVVDAIDVEWVKLSGSKLSDAAFDENFGDKLNECCWAQPVTFMLQVAMYELFISHGIHPKAVLGHSAGEPSAAYASGAYTLEESCYLVYHRSRLQNTLAGCGRMLVLMMDKSTTQSTLERLDFADQIELACFNSPSQSVVCGAEEIIHQLRETLEAEGLPNGTLIAGNIAFHSQHMLPIQEPLHEVLSTLDSEGVVRCGPIPMISTVTGTTVKHIDANYWWGNVRQPVDLLSAITTAQKYVKPEVILEISSHITLRSPIRDYFNESGIDMPNYIYTLVRKSNTADMFAQSLGNCFKAGLPIKFHKLFPRAYPMTILLPHYVMKRERVIDDNLDEKALVKKEHCSAGPMLGRATATDHLSFESIVSKRHYPWMADHVVQGQPLVPAAAYLEMLFEAFKGKLVHIISARCLAPFILTADAEYMYTDITPMQFAPNRFEFRITSRMFDQTTNHKLHVIGVVEVLKDDDDVAKIIPSSVPRKVNDDDGDYNEVLYKERGEFYQAMSARIGDSFGYLHYFQGISKVEFDRKNQKVRADITIDAELWAQWDKMGYLFHPTMFDGCLQSFIVFLMESSDFAGVPQMIKNLVFLKKPSSEHIVVIYEAPEYLRNGGFHQKGQLAFALGEQSAGRCFIYDGKSEELIAYLGDYTSYGSNNKISDMAKFKHYLSWQPKDDVKAETVIFNAIIALANEYVIGGAVKSLISAITTNDQPGSKTHFFLNVAEAVVGKVPERLAMEDCLQTLANAPVQYSLVSSDQQYLSDMYQKFGTTNSAANLRFTMVDEDLSKGFLRPGMFELLIIRLNLEHNSDEGDVTYETEMQEYEALASLASPGSIIFVETLGKDIEHPTSWTSLWTSPAENAGHSFSIFKAPQIVPTLAHTTSSAEETPVHIVVGDSFAFSDFWKSTVYANNPAIQDNIDFETASTWNRVDYFAMLEEGNEDIFDGPCNLTNFVKEVSIRRSGVKGIPVCTFTVFTSGAMLEVTSPSQTGVWGALRSLALEIGDICAIDFRVIDVATKEDLSFVLSVEPYRERELCIHRGHVWTSRLINIREAATTVPLLSNDKGIFKLITTNSGLITDLHFRCEDMPPLEPNQVEISVKASALNFRDIMIGLGRLPLLSFEASMLGRTVGMECSGVVVRCGSEVTDHKVGDKVLAMQGGCIANRIACHEKAAYKLPTNLTFEEGSAVASVYVTAYYALVHLAKMKEGHRILIHSALGGVGQAAIALGKLYGAKIYGTAGSEEKRQTLREMGCIDAFDSRSTNWYHDVMAATNGKGVDIVLNSLAGEHVDLCLEALSPGGFHAEIGKVDIFADRPMKMSVFRKNIAYRAIDVDRLMTDDPKLTYELSMAILQLIQDGKVPALPCTIYSYHDYHDAIRCMMNGQHRGKLVLVPPATDETISVVDDRKLFGNKNGVETTVLMTGCLGGFGLKVISYVVALGARNVVLMDRDPERKRTAEWVLDHAFINFLMGSVEGLRLEIVYGDVGVYSHVVDAVAAVKRSGMPPIGSVFHLAGILDDKKVEDMDRESFKKVYEPKANGAWNLHLATKDITTIEHFVMFSSTSSAFGNPGQANYSAANSFQDGLAAMRIQDGLPGLSFCMGAVVEAGMAARSPQLLNMMKAGGMPAISAIFAIEALDAAIRGPARYNSVAALAKDLSANFDSSDYLRVTAQLIRNNAAFKMGDNSSMSRDALIDLISERVGKLCGVDKLDPTEPFASYGLNSISVAELATYLKNEMNYTVSAMELMTSATCESIADGIIEAQQKKDEDTETKEAEGTTETETESESDDSKEDDDEKVWLEPLVQKESSFLPADTDYFKKSPSSRVAAFAKRQLSFGVDSNLRSIADVDYLSDGSSGPDDKLPQRCQDVLDDLNSYVDSLNVSCIRDAVRAEDIRSVIVTGATGFVGRHFIVDLLDTSINYIETIYCPIRAENDEAAMTRLVEAMEAAGLWNPAYSSRLVAFSGDLLDDCMGLPAERYAMIAEKVDAVYHFASNLNLTAKFDDLKKSNCKTMQSIFRMCLTTRKKHLFLASTLGIFPQYFCQFSNEMADKPIERDAMPDISLMKRIFPLAIAGYAWSKLVNELAATKAKYTKGFPMAIFRLPVMFTNSKTGYSVDGDPWVRLFFASLQLRLIPGKGRPLIVDDSARSNEIMLKISLNPNRRNFLYHCSSQSLSVDTDAPINDMMGFPCENTSYEQFKSQCLKLGPQSPVNAYWGLLDHFSNYWVKFKRYAPEYPINMSTVEEDCDQIPEKSNNLTVFCKVLEWSSTVENPPLNVDLLNPMTDLESILTPARKLCAMYEMEFASVVKPYVIEGLSRICNELNVKRSMRPEVALSLTMRLEARIHLFRLLQLHPEIQEERIDSPIFILGLNRTGTTFLHRMLEASGRVATPHPEDQFLIPKPEQIVYPDSKYALKRLATIKSLLEGVTSNATGIHEVEIGVAEEDMVAHGCSFMSLEYDVLFGLPKYREWLENQELDEVYEEHRTWMQFVSWWRRLQNPHGPKRWCYKFPWHLKSLVQLLNVYPDARLVQTHRDIKDVAGSWCSLVKNQRIRFVESINNQELGMEQLNSLECTLRRGIEFRNNHPEYKEKWLDLQYNYIISSPVEAAKKVLVHGGFTVDDKTSTLISNFVSKNLKHREALAQHKPKFEDYGLSQRDFNRAAFKYGSQNIALSGFPLSRDQILFFVLGGACAGLVPPLLTHMRS